MNRIANQAMIVHTARISDWTIASRYTGIPMIRRNPVFSRSYAPSGSGTPTRIGYRDPHRR